MLVFKNEMHSALILLSDINGVLNYEVNCINIKLLPCLSVKNNNSWICINSSKFPVYSKDLANSVSISKLVLINNIYIRVCL